MFLLPVMLGSFRLVGAWTRLFFDPANFQMMQLAYSSRCFFTASRGEKWYFQLTIRWAYLECHIYHWPIIDQINYYSKNKTGPEIVTGPYYYLFCSFICFSTHDFSWWYPTEYFLENKTTTKSENSNKYLRAIWNVKSWIKENWKDFSKNKKCWSELPSLNFPGDTWRPGQEEQNFKWSSSNSSSSSTI